MDFFRPILSLANSKGHEICAPRHPIDILPHSSESADDHVVGGSGGGATAYGKSKKARGLV